MLNRVYDKVMAGVQEASAVKRRLFEKALASKVEELRRTGKFTHGFYDRLIFNKIKNLLGGNVRVIVTGGAPIAAEVLEFARVGFCCEVVEGYSQTEIAANSFFTR